MLFASLLALALCALRPAAGQRWTPLVVEPCAAASAQPFQFFRVACSGASLSGCAFQSAQNASQCVFSPGKGNLLYLVPCNASDARQHYKWGRGEGGFIIGGGGCWAETAAAPGGPAGDAVGLFGCGANQGIFYLKQAAGNTTQIFSNASGLCLDAQQPTA